MNNDYILVKNEKGELKYFKDGQYFDIDEIDGQMKEIKPTIKPTVEELPNFVLSKKSTDKPRGADEIDKKVDEIIKTLKVSFTDDKLKNRFIKIVKDRLTGERDDKETLYSLQVSRDDGGLSLTDKQARLVLKIITKYLPKVEDKEQTITAPAKTLVLTSSKSPPKKDERLMPEQKAPIIPIPEDRGRVVPPKPLVRKPTISPVNNNIIHDISYTPKLVGPIEELRFMDLDNFHRLGADPVQITDEIFEKLMLLKEESFNKYQQGIQAWQASPVYKIYNEIGVASIMTGKSIDEVIVDRQIKNLPTITQSEFEAIIELNRKIGI